jgi:GDSL-like Lipase/Acylhydrolase family
MSGASRAGPKSMTGGQPSGRWRAFARGLLSQLVVGVITLAAIELVLRVLDLRFLRDGARPGYAFVYRYDADLGWAPVPNARAAFTGSRTVEVRNNSIGLRDLEHDRGGSPRILFIGDSFTWGFDVETKDRFTEILRTRMPQADIVNAGVPGYGTDQEYLLLEKIWDAVRPDVVVLMYCSDNDRFDNTQNIRYDGYFKPYLAQSPAGRWAFRGQPVPKSRRVYFVDNWLVRNLWIARVAVSAYVEVSVPRVTVPDPTERLVAMMRDLVATRGARLLVGVQSREHDPRIGPFLDAQGIANTSFDGAESFDDFGYHWTPKGQAYVADALLVLFARNGIVAAQAAGAADAMVPGATGGR